MLGADWLPEQVH